MQFPLASIALYTTISTKTDQTTLQQPYQGRHRK